MCTSVPQMDVFLIWIRTSLMPGTGTGTRVSSSPSPGLSFAMARMVFGRMAGRECNEDVASVNVGMLLVPRPFFRGDASPRYRPEVADGFGSRRVRSRRYLDQMLVTVESGEARHLLGNQLRSLEGEQFHFCRDAARTREARHFSSSCNNSVTR